MKPILRFIPFFIVLGVMSVVLALPVAGQSTDDTRVYLPLAGRTMLTGPVFTILVGRAAPGDVILTLDFFDGVTTTEFMSTTRGSAGWFVFDKLPLLEPGQFYQASYYNGRYGPPDESKTTIAKGVKITSSVAGGAVSGNPIIDGGNTIRLRSPSDGRQYAISSPLAWDYGTAWFYITIYDLQGNKLYETEPEFDLGLKVEGYLSPFPPELAFDTPYIWQVSILNPDGSEVIENRARREIIFVEEQPLPAPTGLRNECPPPEWGDGYYCDYFWDASGEGIEYSLSGGDDDGWITGTTLRLRDWCGVSHTWRVRARNETAESTWSETVTITPPGCPPPPPCEPAFCMREIFKEQPEWQPHQREPY